MPTDPSLLLVEGQDDRHFVKQLWEKDKGSKPSFGISDREGFDNLIKVISQGIKTSGREVFGILVDANSDPTNRWEQITSKLKQVASELSDEIKHPQLDLDEIPDAPDPNGTIIDSKPRIGIWLMPNNKSPGELEDFAAKMVPDDDPVWPLSKEYIQNIPKQHRKFNCDKMPKAELFAWLATRYEPGRMGAAIGTNGLTLDNKPSETFLNWLTELFE